MQKEQKENTIEFVEEKFERRLTEEISGLRVDMHKSQANLLRWMFVFWITQIGTIAGLIFAFLK